MLAILIRWLIFLHVLAALTFYMAHGASATMAFKVRKETDFARIRALLDLSTSTFITMGVSFLVMGLTGLGLIAAPLVLLLLAFGSALLEVNRGPFDAGVLLADIAAHPTRTQVASLLSMLESVLFLPAFVGLIHLLRDRGVVLGHLGGGLALLGALGNIVTATHLLVYVQMTTGGADQTQMAALMNRIEGDTALLPVRLSFVGFSIGLLLLGIGLWRAQVKPRWAAAGIVLAIVLFFIGIVISGIGIVTSGGGQIIMLIVVVYAGLAISLGAIGWSVLRMSDRDWERPPEQGDKQLQAAH